MCEELNSTTLPMDVTSRRRSHLTGLLLAAGLTYDADNEICLQYTYLGDNALYNNPVEIVDIMSQTRFLNEYCDHEAGLRLARNQCASVRLPRDQWLQRVRRCVLKCSGYTQFPDVWPWKLPHSTIAPMPICNIDASATGSLERSLTKDPPINSNRTSDNMRVRDLISRSTRSGTPRFCRGDRMTSKVASAFPRGSSEDKSWRREA